MQLKDFPTIKNIIFDLGNVIIDLDTDATKFDLKNIYGPDYEINMAELKESNVFSKYEKGQISTQTFLNELSAFDDSISHDEIKNAWNAMLLDIPDDIYKLLKKTKNTYRTFCLSNTNKLHIEYIYKQLKQTKGVNNLDSYFEKVYLSHEMGMRKPDAAIFESVLSSQGLIAEETLFIDDTEEHILGAQKVGLQTLHLTPDLILSDFFTA